MTISSITFDLDEFLDRTHADLEVLRGARILLTGGTGFFGKWLIEVFAQANRRMNLKVDLVVLSRKPNRFIAEEPYFANLPGVHYVQGDVCRLPMIPGPFSEIIHAATDVASPVFTADYSRILSTCVHGTREICEFAAAKQVRRVLLTSSGAVYGVQPPELERIPEDYPGAPDPLAPGSAYGEGKRASEWLICHGARTAGYEAKIARCFAFIGPYLTLDGPFAIGNFMRDAIASHAISISGDGRSYRSYLYSSDLMSWLLAILVRGRNATAYNVGGDAALSIHDLAKLIRDLINPAGRIDVHGKSHSTAPSRYVPSTEKIRKELGVRETVLLPEAIRRTARWYSAKHFQ